MKFTHLHVHTQYSLLDGSAKIKELVPRAKNLAWMRWQSQTTVRCMA